MNTKLFKIAAVIAFLIGIMSVFAGGLVAMGKPMDYYIIDWLPIYNLVVGLVSAFFITVIIWRGNQIAIPAAVMTLAGHIMVLLILLTSYRDVVAPESIGATIFRIIVWLSILILMMLQTRISKRFLQT